MKGTFLVGVAILVALAVPAQATPTINVGTYIATNFQILTVDLFVTGGDPIDGIDLLIQLGSGSGLTPKITDVQVVDIDPGWMFAPNGYGNAGSNSAFAPPGNILYSSDQFWEVGGLTESGSVGAEGRIARITIDTHGAAYGIYLLTLRTNQYDIPSTWSNDEQLGMGFDGNDGIVIIGPEPSSVVLGALAVAGLAAVTIRERWNRRGAGSA